MRAQLGIAELAEAAEACRDFYRGKKGRPGLLTRILKSLFDKLSMETRLRLAKDVTVEMTAFMVVIKDRFGEGATAVVDGNEIKIGMKDADHFREIGKGGSWREALQAAEEHDAENDA